MAKDTHANREKRQQWEKLKEEEKKFKEFLNSEENKSTCKPFGELCEKYILLYKKYKDSYKELSADVDAKVYRVEYSKGGIGVIGGFYSPTNLDLIAGGMHKGRLYKRVPKENAYDFKYYFDKENRLICTEYYTDEFGEFELYSKLLFVYNEDTVTSLLYDGLSSKRCELDLGVICRSYYENGLLTRYERALCSLGICCELNVEEFEYSNGLLSSFFWYHYNGDGFYKTLDKYKFILQRDEEGYITKYKAENLYGYNLPNKLCNNQTHVYTVSVSDRRK